MPRSFHLDGSLLRPICKSSGLRPSSQQPCLELGKTHRRLRSPRCCTMIVGTPQVLSRMVKTRVPGLAPSLTSETFLPARSRRSRVRSASAVRPYTIAAVLVLSRAMNDLDQHIRAGKLHQPVFVLRIDPVKDHGKSETCAVKECRALGVRRCDHQEIETEDVRRRLAGRGQVGLEIRKRDRHSMQGDCRQFDPLPGVPYAPSRIAFHHVGDRFRRKRQPL